MTWACYIKGITWNCSELNDIPILNGSPVASSIFLIKLFLREPELPFTLRDCIIYNNRSINSRQTAQPNMVFHEESPSVPHISNVFFFVNRLELKQRADFVEGLTCSTHTTYNSTGTVNICHINKTCMALIMFSEPRVPKRTTVTALTGLQHRTFFG